MCAEDRKSTQSPRTRKPRSGPTAVRRWHSSDRNPAPLGSSRTHPSESAVGRQRGEGRAPCSPRPCRTTRAGITASGTPPWSSAVAGETAGRMLDSRPTFWYSCNMHVAPETARETDSVDEALTGLTVASFVLISGPPGFGKSSVLASAVSRFEKTRSCEVQWIPGRVVASEGHFWRLLGFPEGKSAAGTRSLLSRYSARQLLLAVDDVDALLFKREHLAAEFGSTIQEAAGSVLLVATCHVSAARRLMTASPLGRALGGAVKTVQLCPYSDQEARSLVERRAPTLDRGFRDLIVAESGGHPAALVFLARLAEMRSALSGTAGVEAFLDRAAELAGAVYSEPWALLGPQQRAILWVIGCRQTALTAGQIAETLLLKPSHVSSQVKRLVDEGLLHRSGERAHFQVPSLLARWISRRAARECETSGPLRSAVSIDMGEASAGALG
jgi:hypothetical protein